jgi:hypothetical protein
MSSGKGDLSRLYETTDGCQTWKLLFTNPDKDGFWDALYFDHDHQSGWILGDPVKRQFTIFSSDNAGRTWMRQRNAGLKARAEGQGAFAASNSSICESNGGIEFGTGGSEGAYLYLKTDAEIVLSDPSSGATKFEHQIGWERNEVPVGNHSESSSVTMKCCGCLRCAQCSSAPWGTVLKRVCSPSACARSVSMAFTVAKSGARFHQNAER